MNKEDLMIILLFGISNVGKTSIARVIAEKYGYKFFDLDDSIKKAYGTIDNFQDEFPYHFERNRKHGEFLEELITTNKDTNAVISVTPIYFADNFNYLLDLDYVYAFEIQDSVKNIFDRLVFADENDVVYKDDEYKNKYKAHYLREIEEDIKAFRPSFEKIKHKIRLHGKTPEEGAKMVMNRLSKIVNKR